MQKTDEKRTGHEREGLGVPKESEKLYKSLFEFNQDILEHSPAGIIKLDKEMRIKYENPEMKRIIGVPPGEESKAMGLDIRKIPPIREAGVVPTLNDLSTGKEISWEGLFTSIYGKRTYLSVKGVPILEDGKFAGAVLLMNDITERKQAEETLKNYQLMVESAHHAIFYKDLKGRYVIANAKALEAFGLSREEVIGKNDYELMPNQEEAKKNIEDDQFVFKTGKPTEITKHMTSGDGKGFWFQAIKVPQFDDKGNIIGLVGIASDVTEHKEIEEKLIRLSNAVRMSTESIVVSDLKGKIIEINDATLKMYGTDEKEDLIGKSSFELIALEDRKKAFAAMKEVMKKGYIKDREYHVVTKDGSRIPVEMSVSIMKDVDGEPIGFVGITRDITERKRAEEEMKGRLMKFKLKEGKLYLVKEPTPTLALEALQDLLNIGYKGIIISRTPEEEFLGSIEGELRFLWLAEKGKGSAIKPDLKGLEKRIDVLPRKTVVLLDRLDYLIFKSGFKKALSFVQHLKEITYLNGPIVILSIDPSTLDSKEIALLEKEGNKVEPIHAKVLSDELFDILKFIYRQNTIAIKPSYVRIGKELKISRPTVRKRITILCFKGFVTEEIRGRNKAVGLTEKGRRLFWD